MNVDDFLSALENDDMYSHYPADFLKEYTIMECLSERNGIDTFLVQNQTGQSFIAKCYDTEFWNQTGENHILGELQSVLLPKQMETFENKYMVITVREYIDGISLDCYAAENELSADEIVGICVKLCDILEVLHHREEPVIHRDIKPQNIIVRPDGEIALIDFDIARIFFTDRCKDRYLFFWYTITLFINWKCKRK